MSTECFARPTRLRETFAPGPGPRWSIAALLGASIAWGFTVPLSAVALHWLTPASLVTIRFGIAALVLAFATPGGPRSLRAALTPQIVVCGGLAYGGMVLAQDYGIGLTSVSHVALLGGIVPALVLVASLMRGGPRPTPRSALGLACTVGGVVLAAGSGGRVTAIGDAVVLLSSVLATLYVITQPALFAKQRAVAVTAVQMFAASLFTLPLALLTGHLQAPSHAGPIFALLGLIAIGSLLPFTLYAWARPRVPDAVAGAFYNVETLVASLAGVFAFHDPMGLRQALGMAVIIGGAAAVAMWTESAPLAHAATASRARGPSTQRPPTRLADRGATSGAELRLLLLDD